MEKKKQNTMLAASIAGMVAAAGVFGGAPVVHAEEVPCYGVNKCKGTGDCGGKGHSCAGKNACAGHGWIEMDKEDCLRIEGGRLTKEKSES